MIFYIGQQRFADADISYCRPEDALRYFKDRTLIQLDLETTGLDPKDDSILLLQVGTSEHQFVFDMNGSAPLDPIAREIITKPSAQYIGHNIKFDVKFLKSYDVEMHNIWDTMLADKVCWTGLFIELQLKFSLAHVLMRRLEVHMSKEMQSSFIDHVGPFSAAQIKYAAKDVEHLEEVREIQYEEIAAADLVAVAKLENAVCLSFADMEYDGLGVDVDRWDEIADDAMGVRDSLTARMDDMILTRPELERFKPKSFQASMFGSEVEDLRDAIGINWSSQKQVLPVIQSLTSSEIETLDTKLMRRDWGGSHNMVDAFISYVDMQKKATSFGRAWTKKFVRTDGRVHTSIDQVKATGRVGSSTPNLQQIPSDAAYRDCFKPADGHTFITTDYGSQELVVIATGAKDPVWIDALENGHDLHSICAALVFGEKWTQAGEEGCAFEASKDKCGCPAHKKLRTRTKAISFGLAYGAGPGSLSESLQITKAEAEKLMKDYFSAFPRIKGWLDGNARSAIRKRESRTFLPFARRRLFQSGDIDFKTRSMIDRRGRNSVIQGTGADMTKLAQVLLRTHLLGARDEARLVCAVHDELLVEVKIGFEDRWCGLIQESMEEAARIVLGNTLCKATPEVGPNWAK